MAKKPTTTEAKPGTTDAAAEKPEKEPKRTPHPHVGNEDPKIYPFGEVPADYDWDKHSGLKKKDFSHEHTYFEYRAADYARKQQDMLARAAEAKELGSTKDRAARKRFVKMTEKIGDLRKKLEAQGVDVNALLAADAS